LVDEDDAAVEIAFLAGDPLVDGVRDDVGDPPPIVGGGVVLLAAQLLAGEHVPQPELGLETAVGLGDAAGRQRLGIDLPPVGQARQRGGGGVFFVGGGGIDRRDQAGPPQV